MASSSSSAYPAHNRPPTMALTRSLSAVSAVMISSGSERSPSPFRKQKSASEKQKRQEVKRSNSKLFSSPSFTRRTRERLSYSYRRGSADDHSTCEEKYYRLQRKYSRLSERYDAKCEEYLTLLETVGNRLGSTLTPTEGSATAATHIPKSSVPEKYAGLTRDNAAARFPAIKFWTRSSFMEFSDAKKPLARRKAMTDIMEVNDTASISGYSGNNKGESIPYAELDDGSVMDESTSAAVRSLLRQVFNEMADRLPLKWGDVSLTDSQYVYSQLYTHYPCFLLCFDDWKACYIVSRSLTSFHGTRKKKERKQARQNIKIEPIVEGTKDEPSGDTAELLIDSGKKRKNVNSGDDNKEPPPKRLHSEPEPSSPPPSLSSPLSSVSAMNTLPLPQHPAIAIPGPVLLLPREILLAPVPSSPPHTLSATTTPATTSTASTSSLQDALFSSVDHDVSTTNPPSDHNDASDDGNNDGHDLRDIQLEHNLPQTLDQNTAPVPPSANASGRISKRVMVGNPLIAKFGVPTAPTKRLEALKKAREAQQEKDGLKGKTTEVPADLAGSGSSSSGSAAPSSGLKKVTKSLAAKNLCYIAYLEGNDPITPAAFEKYWKGLPKDDIKHWNDLSKSKKAVSAPEDKDDENN